jgi:hypothetical protein
MSALGHDRRRPLSGDRANKDGALTEPPIAMAGNIGILLQVFAGKFSVAQP